MIIGKSIVYSISPDRRRSRLPICPYRRRPVLIVKYLPTYLPATTYLPAYNYIPTYRSGGEPPTALFDSFDAVTAAVASIIFSPVAAAATAFFDLLYFTRSSPLDCRVHKHYLNARSRRCRYYYHLVRRRHSVSSVVST